MNFTDSQKEALKEGGNFLVSASAGSGKTAVMIQRIIDTLERGGKISRILALTFTNAAAEEMKDKLVTKLYESIRQNDSKITKHLRAQIADIPFSYICTIDSFCLGLYRTYFEDINGTPLFEVLDKEEADDIFKGICREVISECLLKKDENMLRLIDSFVEARSYEPLVDAVCNLHIFLNAQEDCQEFITRARSVVNELPENTPPVKYLVKLFKSELKQLQISLKALYNRINATLAFDVLNSKYSDGLLAAQDLLDTFLGAKSLQEICHLLSQTIEIEVPRDRKALAQAVYEEIRKGAQSFLRALKKFFKDWRLDFMCEEGFNSYDRLINYETDANAVMLSLIDLTLIVTQKYDEYKQKEGRPDFADLERFAYRILQNDDRAKQVSDGLDYIFLDEYQDINHLQEAIIKKCSKDNVFMVGDVKQSIYGFRHAQPSIFINKKKSFDDLAYGVSAGKNVRLNENFRSHVGILDFVNLIFEELMTEDFGEIDYQKESRLVGGLKDKNSFQHDKSIENPIHICFFDEKSMTAEQKRQQISRLSIPYSPLRGQKLVEEPDDEAIYIAQTIEDLVGKKMIFDTKLQKKRYCEYKDIAIIMRKRKGKEIGSQLKLRKIPFIAEGFEAGDSPMTAVKTIINYLSVIDNYQNDYTLFAAMRSFFGGFSEADMVEIRRVSQDGFFWKAVTDYNEDDKIKERIDKFFGQIDEFRRLSAYISVDALINVIMAKTGYDNYLLGFTGVEEIEALNAFVFGLRGRETTKSLTTFVKYYQDKELDIKMIPGGDNYVSFFTVHSSKGLEFPIVFLAGCQMGLNKRALARAAVLMDPLLGVGVKYKEPINKVSSMTLSFKAFQKNAEKKEREELLRLLYVAMTRARYYLYITGQKCAEKFIASDCDNFSEYIALALKRRSIDMPMDNFVARQNLVSLANNQVLPIKKDEQIADTQYIYPYKDSLTLFNKYTVSEVAAKGKGRKYHNMDTQSIDIGNTYHQFLQELDFSLTTFNEVKDAILDFENVNPAAKGVIDAANILWFLKSEVFDGLDRFRAYKEKPFLLYLPANELFGGQCRDKVLLQGVFDLLIVGEKNRLVDYKLTGMDAESAKERYKEQLRLYSIAAEKLLNIRLDESIICLVNQKKLIKV